MTTLQNRLLRRVQHAFHLCWTTTAADESGPVGKVQMVPDDVRTFEDVPLVQHFGFASSLPIGSQVVRMSALGDTSKGWGVASVHGTSRPTGLTSGQTVVYDLAGSRVFLPNDGTIRLSAPDETLHQLVTDVFVQLFNTHTHNHGPVPDQKMSATHLTGATRAGGPAS